MTIIRNFYKILKILFLQNYEMLIQTCISALIVLVVFSASISFGEEEQFSIPNWIKETAGFWSQNEISDQDFLNSVAYLINNDLLYVEKLENIKTENEILKTENQILLEMNDVSLQPNTSNTLEITVHTNKEVYGPDDYIVIVGTVSKLIDDQKVSVVVSSQQGTFISIAKITPNSDGSYAFVSSDNKFKEFGKYLVNVYYAGKAYEQTTYSFTPKP